MISLIRSIIIGVLTVGIIGVGYWGYKEYEDKNALLIHAENSYQRSFHELSYYMDLLHDKIGTSLAMNTGERLSPQFVDIWRLTSQALNDVSQLPLSLVPIHETEEFLANIGDFTYKTSIRNLDDDPLTDEEVEKLEHLYNEASEIKDNLRQMQHTALKENLRWMDVELALATNEGKDDNVIIDGFETVNKQINDFSESDVGNSMFEQTSDKNQYKQVKGKKYNEKEILKYSKDLLGLKNDEEINIEKSGKGASIPTYTVFYHDDKKIYMDITEQGAHPISILVDREVKEPTISLNDGLLKAEEYISQFDYDEMTLLQSQQFDGVGVYTFLSKEDDVRIFPDQIMVKVALDTGEIIGFNSEAYLMNHHKRTIPEATLSLEEARDKVNKEVEIQEEHFALIENDLDEEVLTYEFLGTMQEETYRIFINAENGIEEKVDKLTGTETNFEVNM